MTLYNARKVFNPPWFQGNGKKKNYFEGWYFKVVSADGKNTWAFIPGISYSGKGNHSFIQVINGITGKTWYFKYPVESFAYSRNSFNTKVSDSHFSEGGFQLNMKEGNDSFSGEIQFIEPVRFPVRLARPGIMGWYRYVPFMECYHGVVSLHHGLKGSLTINREVIDFSGGKGYVEKDWGTSMPKSWVWMQSNHFEPEKTSFMLSVARIPWLGSSFTGFLGFMLHQGRLYPFATYTGASIRNLKISDETVEVTIHSKDFAIHVKGRNSSRGLLKAPVGGDMQRVIHESVDAELHVRLTDKKGLLLFEGTGSNAGLELVGDTSLLK